MMAWLLLLGADHFTLATELLSRYSILFYKILYYILNVELSTTVGSYLRYVGAKSCGASPSPKSRLIRNSYATRFEVMR